MPPGSGGNGETGGTGGDITAGPCPAQPLDPKFTLRWEDNFDSFDDSRWQKRDHSFAENLARFNFDNAVAEEGYLKLRLTNDPSGDGDNYKAYAGAEVMTTDTFQYGRFDTCAKWGDGFGIVASFFTYADGEWNEIDIEYLGYNPVGIQYNLIWDTNPGQDRNLAYDPYFDVLGVDAADDFHQYSVEWVPGELRFYVDGMLRHIESEASAVAIDSPTTLRMNLWISDTEFAGNGHDPGAVPSETLYDWVRVYDYTP